MSKHDVTTSQETELLTALQGVIYRQGKQPSARNNTDRQVLNHLHLLNLARADIEQRLREAVEAARDGSSLQNGPLTWAEIGDALSVTKQAAQQRYGQ